MPKGPPPLPGKSKPSATPTPRQSPKLTPPQQASQAQPNPQATHPEARETNSRPTDTRRSGMGAVVLHHSVTALMIMLIFALAVWSYLSFRNTDFFEAPAKTSRVATYVETAQKERIRFALEVIYRLDGRYPLKLEELVERNLLAPSDLYYPLKSTSPRHQFSYERTQKSYTLDFARPAPAAQNDL